MNTLLAHAHLIISHVPIVLSVFGTVFYLLHFRYQQLHFTALLLLIIAGVIILFVPFTGEEAQHLLMDSGVNASRDTIHTHKEAGEMARNIMVITALVAAFELYGHDLWHRYKIVFISILTLLCTLSTISLSVTGYTGGQIRHTELGIQE